MNSATLSSPRLRVSKPFPGAGGNLARVTCNALSTQTGHFLFSLKQPQKFGAQFTNAGRGSSPSSTSAGAAFYRRALMSAKSRPLPFSKVNHVAHNCVSQLSKYNNLGELT